MVTPVDGVIVASDTLGARFSTVVVVLSEALSPSPSTTDTAQVTTSLGMAPAEDKSNVVPLPTTVEPIDHS